MSADRIVGVAFLALAILLGAGAAQLPAGMGRTPGPGFFPSVIAGVMALLSLGLIAGPARAAKARSGERPHFGQAAAVAGLTLAWLLLWGTGFFSLRTAVFLILLLKLLGQSWRASAGVAALLTAVVFGAFQVGLRVSLE